MDPVTLILTALATGAAASLQETATQAVKDAYAGLKALVSKCFQGNPKAEVALQAHAEDPQTWQKPMEQAIKDTGADKNEELLKMAKDLMALLDESQAKGAKYNVQFSGDVKGVSQGDHNTVTMTFNETPEPKKRK